MCQFCFDRITIDLAGDLYQGKSIDVDKVFNCMGADGFVLESKNPYSAIAYRLAEMGKNQATPAVSESNWIGCTSMICRLLEVAVTRGFNSSSYQKYLQLENLTTVVSGFFEHSAPQVADSFQQHNILNTLDIPSILLSGKNVESLKSPELHRECEAVLTNYLESEMGKCFGRWHDRSISSEEYPANFPFVYLSFVIIRKYHPRNPLLSRLILGHPKCVTGLNLGLWFQRKVAQHLYILHGIDAFLPYGQDYYRMIIYHLVLTNDLKPEEKEKLAREIGDYHSEEERKAYQEILQYSKLYDVNFPEPFILKAIGAI